jgi:hypothetical protein
MGRSHTTIQEREVTMTREEEGNVGDAFGGGGGAIFHAHRPEFLVKYTQRASTRNKARRGFP